MRFIQHILAVSLLLLLSLTLSSCMFPEEFESEVTINQDGTFVFAYDGVLTFVIARAEEVKKGGLSPQAEKKIKELEEEIKKDAGFKKVDYIGHSQFKVLYQKEGSLDKPFYFVSREIDLFTITPKDGGLVELKGMALREKDIRELESINLTIDGELTVNTDGEVIEHNANSTPSLFGLMGGYSWEIKSLSDPQPSIIIKIK